MGIAVITTLAGARRLTVAKQRLSGKLPKKGTKEDLLSVVKDLAFVQWDPVTVVAPSHLISFWSRVGDFDPCYLDTLLWEKRDLLLHWTPLASIVDANDYPIYSSLMERYPDSLTKSWGGQRERAKKFIASHGALRRGILRELESGPRMVDELSGYVRKGKDPSGWGSDADASTMLFHMLCAGEVMVVGHRGAKNLWGLVDDFLPGWVERDPLPEDEMEERAAEKAIKALGTATPSEIHFYFVRGRYQNLKRALKALEDRSAVSKIEVSGLKERETRYIHRDDLGLLERVSGDSWEPRVSLISPFDTILNGRRRAQTLFGFDYVHEQFIPKEKRRYGTYVVPILAGERFVGRLDPKLDKEDGRLVINSVHREPGAPVRKETGKEIAGAIARLAEFVGAREVAYTRKVPEVWKGDLR